MKRTVFSIISVVALCLPFPVFAYSQDPVSCNDPRTQYPSNPPCYKINM